MSPSKGMVDAHNKPAVLTFRAVSRGCQRTVLEAEVSFQQLPSIGLF